MVFKQILRLAVMATAVVGAWAHGFITSPIARNIGSGTYCDMCQSGGGVWEVYPGGRKYPNGVYGACGDPVNGKSDAIPHIDKSTLTTYHEGGGKYEQTVGIRVTHYHAGDTIQVKGQLTANHIGYIAYFLCVLPASAVGIAERQHLTNSCFDRTPLRVLQDGAWNTRFYVTNSLGPFSMAVKLPDIECPRCVLRWYYITGNSCTPPGTPSKYASPGLGTCGSGSAPNPEEFWNCADVALLKKGSTLPATSTRVLKGELSTGESAPNDSGGSDGGSYSNGTGLDSSTAIEYPDDDGTDGAGDPTLLSFQDVMISIVIGTGLGTPVVLFSPTIGIAAGICVVMAVLAAFLIWNSSKDNYTSHTASHCRKWGHDA